MRSLRVRVALAAAAVIATSLLGGGWAILAMRSSALEADFTASVVARLSALAAGTEFEDGRLEWHGGLDGGLDAVVAIRDAGGRLVAGEAWVPAAPSDGSLDHPAVTETLFPGGARGLSASAWFKPTEDTRHHGTDDDDPRGVLRTGSDVSLPVSISVVMRRDRLDRELADMRRTLVIVGLATAAVAGIVLALVLRHLLRHHATLADGIAGLDPRRSGFRLPTSGLPAELQPVAGRVNELCDRLERALSLASSVHAAAAHELRTPLAGMRATIEVAIAQGGDREAALRTCLDIALQMQRRVDNLLVASRLDAGQITPNRDEVDIHDLLRQLWSVQVEKARRRLLEPAWDLTGTGIAIGDVETLRMVISNLFDNAVSHSLRPGRIGISTRDTAGWIELVVDNASTLSPEDAKRVFERGWRGATASAGTRHAGLGMGICRELVALMDGRIQVGAAGGRFSVVIALPAPEADPAA